MKNTRVVVMTIVIAAVLAGCGSQMESEISESKEESEIILAETGLKDKIHVDTENETKKEKYKEINKENIKENINHTNSETMIFDAWNNDRERIETEMYREDLTVNDHTHESYDDSGDYDIAGDENGSSADDIYDEGISHYEGDQGTEVCIGDDGDIW